MSDPYKRPDGILPNFAHIPTQPVINGAQLNPLYYQHSNLLTQQQQQQQQQNILQQLQQQQQQLNQQLLQQQQQQQQMLQQPIYSNNQYTPYISPMYQQPMQLPIQPYIGSTFPNQMFYQSLPVPSNSPFTELRGPILPPIHPLLPPHPPKEPRGKFGASDRIARLTRKEAALVIQSYWRGYMVRRHVRPILRRNQLSLRRGGRRGAVDSVCRSVAGEIIAEAVEVMVANFVIEWLDYKACMVLLDLECFVLRDRIVDDVINEDFMQALVSECLIEVISAEFYNELVGGETRDVLLAELNLPRNTLLLRKLTVNDIRDNLLAGGILDEFIFSELVSHLDEQNYDLSRAREMDTVRDELIMSALISLIEQVDT